MGSLNQIFERLTSKYCQKLRTYALEGHPSKAGEYATYSGSIWCVEKEAFNITQGKTEKMDCSAIRLETVVADFKRDHSGKIRDAEDS